MLDPAKKPRLEKDSHFVRAPESQPSLETVSKPALQPAETEKDGGAAARPPPAAADQGANESKVLNCQNSLGIVWNIVSSVTLG